jgi:hypothetical protein
MCFSYIVCWKLQTKTGGVLITTFVVATGRTALYAVRRMSSLSWITLTRSCHSPLLHISTSRTGCFSYQLALLLVALCWSGLELRWDLFTLSLISVDLICLSCCIYKKAVTVPSNLSGTEEKVDSVHLVIHKSGFSACSGAPGFQFHRIWLNRNLFVSFILAIQCNHNCYWKEQWHMNHSNTDIIKKSYIKPYAF